MEILFKPSYLVILSAFVLTACNGGGGGSTGVVGGTTDTSNTTTTTTQQTPPPVVINEVATDFKSDCSTVDTGCGSKSDSIYTGTGVGVWNYTNTTKASATVNLGINNTQGKNLYLVYSNTTDADVTLNDGNGFGTRETNNFKASQFSSSNTPDLIAPPDISSIANANKNKRILSASTPVVIPTYQVGDVRSQYNMIASTPVLFNTLLVAKRQLSNGAYVYFWVDTAKVNFNQALIDSALDDYVKKDGIFDTLVKISGDFTPKTTDQTALDWLISPQIKDQHIIVTTLNGPTGMYYAMSEYSYATLPQHPPTNAQHEIYVDSSQITGDISNKKRLLATIAHETQHELYHFNKTLGLGNDPANTVLNEFSSVMAENIAESIVSSSTDGTWRLTSYLSTNTCMFLHDYNADTSDSSCNPVATYDPNYMLGALLLRKYGAEFLSSFITSKANSIADVDSVIKSFNAKDSLGNNLIKTAVAPLVGNEVVSGYNYPTKKTDLASLYAMQFNDYFYSKYGSLNNFIKMYKTVPALLKSRSNVIQYINAVSNPFQKYIQVPTGVTVTAVLR